MDRRQFLIGTVASVAAGAVVVKATESEIAAFGTVREGAPVGVNTVPSVLRGIEPGSWLYNMQGERVAVIREVASGPEFEDFYSADRLVAIRMADNFKITLKAECYGHLEYDDAGLLRVRA